MERSNAEKAENLKARLKCVQADIFCALKRYINIFSFDEELKRIIKQPYTVVDNTKYTLGLDGKRVYGLIVEFDEKKRNEIIQEALKQMKEGNVDNDRKFFDMYGLITAYETANNAIKKVSLVPALEHHLNTLSSILNGAIELEMEFKPKCFN